MEVPATVGAANGGGEGSSLSRNSSLLSELDEPQSQSQSQSQSQLQPHPNTARDAVHVQDSMMELDNDDDDEGARLASNNPQDTDSAMTTLDDDPRSYSSRVAARIALLKNSVSSSSSSSTLSTLSPKSYSFQPILSIPQSTVNVHALALPPCASHLYTSGSDGFIRRYAWYPTLRSQSRQLPVLKSYWENPTIAALEVVSPSDVSKARFGPAGVSSLSGNTAPVHALAVHSQEMYTLAGSAEGVVNLFSTRIDEGQCRASLGLDKSGHARGQPVSVLALNEADSTLLSGGWDCRLLVRFLLLLLLLLSPSSIVHQPDLTKPRAQQWDLNTGVCTRKYDGHKAQLTAIQFRPESIVTAAASPSPAAAQGPEAEASQSPARSRAEKGSDATKPDLASAAAIEKSGVDDAASENSYDPLFDDDGDGGHGQEAQQSGDGSGSGGLGSGLGSTEADTMLMGSSNSLNTLSAPSAGLSLSLPGLSLPSAAPGPHKAQAKAAGLAPAGGVPAAAKLPELARVARPSFADAQAELPDLCSGQGGGGGQAAGNDVFLSAALDGECLIWDRRAAAGKEVRQLDIPRSSAPWTISVRPSFLCGRRRRCCCCRRRPKAQPQGLILQLISWANLS